jgi:hypothetical protein
MQLVNKPRLIAIHGRKRAGKGTVSDYLVRTHGFRLVKFSQPLKEMLLVLLESIGMDIQTAHRCIEGDLKEAPVAALGGKSARYAMQTLGTEWRDLFIPTMWADITISKIRSLLNSNVSVTLDDFRFEHECSILSDEGGEFWLVESSRPEVFLALEDLPDCLLGERRFLPMEETFLEMTAVLMEHCSLDSEAEKTREGIPTQNSIALLGGRTPKDVFNTLRIEWSNMMRLDVESHHILTSGHVSEKGLPRDIFKVCLTNNSNFEDLYAQIEIALVS